MTAQSYGRRLLSAAVSAASPWPRHEVATQAAFDKGKRRRHDLIYKPWKNEEPFFQALENQGGLFPGLGKFAARLRGGAKGACERRADSLFMTPH
jgi:hypothetical protein